MLTNIGNKTWGLLRHLIPLLTAVTFILVSTITWPIPYWGTIAPSFGLAAVFYWSVYRPDLFRPMAVFALGLLVDILHMAPLGMTACIYLITHQLSFTNRRFFVGQVFYMLWTGFMIAVLLNMSLSWIVMSFDRGQLVPLFPVIIQNLLTLAVFPLPAWILIKLQRLFLTREGT